MRNPFIAFVLSMNLLSGSVQAGLKPAHLEIGNNKLDLVMTDGPNVFLTTFDVSAKEIPPLGRSQRILSNTTPLQFKGVFYANSGSHSNRKLQKSDRPKIVGLEWWPEDEDSEEFTRPSATGKLTRPWLIVASRKNRQNGSSVYQLSAVPLFLENPGLPQTRMNPSEIQIKQRRKDISLGTVTVPKGMKLFSATVGAPPYKGERKGAEVTMASQKGTKVRIQDFSTYTGFEGDLIEGRISELVDFPSILGIFSIPGIRPPNFTISLGWQTTRSGGIKLAVVRTPLTDSGKTKKGDRPTLLEIPPLMSYDFASPSGACRDLLGRR